MTQAPVAGVVLAARPQQVCQSRNVRVPAPKRNRSLLRLAWHARIDLLKEQKAPSCSFLLAPLVFSIGLRFPESRDPRNSRRCLASRLNSVKRHYRRCRTLVSLFQKMSVTGMRPPEIGLLLTVVVFGRCVSRTSAVTDEIRYA